MDFTISLAIKQFGPRRDGERLFPQWTAVQQEVGVSTLECGMTMALAGHLVGNCLKEQSQTNRVRHIHLVVFHGFDLFSGTSSKLTCECILCQDGNKT